MQIPRELNPNSAGFYAQGVVNSAGDVCTLAPNPLLGNQTGYANPSGSILVYNGFNALLNGSNISVAGISVVFNFLDFVSGSYIAPTIINIGGTNITQPITIGIGAAQFYSFLGYWPAVKITVTNYNGGSGNFRAEMCAY